MADAASKKPTAKQRAEADAAATDTPNRGAHATAATEMSTSNEDRREASDATPDALTTPPHLVTSGSDTFPLGNPALASAVFAENQDAAAAAGKGDPFPRRLDELASHRAGITPDTEARAVRMPTQDEIDEAKALADAAKRDQIARIADAADVLNAAAGRT